MVALVNTWGNAGGNARCLPFLFNKYKLDSRSQNYSEVYFHPLGHILDVGYYVASMNSKDLRYLLLYGNPNESTFANRIIPEATISFIKILDVLIKPSGKTAA